MYYITMINKSEVIDNYPNIARIFTPKWFESKIDKKSNHTLIKQLILDDEDSSFEYINNLEKLLDTLKDEINANECRKHFSDRLKNEDHFKNTLAELKIGCMFKKMGFNIEFEPIVQNQKRSDIRAIINDVEIFIEVSTRIGPEVKWIEMKESGIEIGTFKSREPRKFSDKITEEGIQLSKEHPGIVALYLTSYGPEKRNIIRAFGFSFVWDKDSKYVEPGENIDNSDISALLLCDISNNLTLCVNPLAKIQLPIIVIKKLEEIGTDVIHPHPLQIEE